MKTTYSNTSNPTFVKWSSAIAFIVGIVFFILYILIDNVYGVLLYIASLSLIYGIIFIGQYKLLTIEIDDEADTITDSRQKKYPLKISNLTSATYKENKKGTRFRSLFLHDSGIGFMEIRTSKEQADKIVEQLLTLNPGIEIKHANYI